MRTANEPVELKTGFPGEELLLLNALSDDKKEDTTLLWVNCFTLNCNSIKPNMRSACQLSIKRPKAFIKSD
ncbi:hypothetical protein VNO77_02630 [Canavalia gladiata]|uniref:Uncharacterized protein n=1 Tax=Canavalia gladiata TaxID=3824 RepID=A0AAN9MYK5_CANGL